MSTAAPPRKQPGTSPTPQSQVQKTPRSQISGRKKVLFLVIMLSLTWLCVEGMVLVYLRSNGFYWNRQSKPRLVNEMPNNLVENPRYIWEYLPGSQYTYTDPRDKATYHVQVNSEKFRDEEPAARAHANYKFIALGDSFTFGWLVEHKDRWDEVLARLLKEKHGLNAASINRAMWMTTFDQHALMLEDNFPKESCQAVIHFVYPSHLQTANRHTVKTENGKIVSVYDPLLHLKDNALFFGAADAALVHKQLSFPFSLCMWRFHQNLRLLEEQIAHAHSVPEMTDEQIYQQKTQSIFQNGYDLMERSIAQIASFLKKKNIPYIVVVIPRDRQLNEAEWNGVTPIPEILETAIPQQRFREACEKTGYAQMIDLLPDMKKHYNDKLYYKHDAHWRPEGHRMAAERVLEFMVQRGMLPKAVATHTQNARN
ncbi:MAG: hypothetical protein Tsb009_36620 [Planctomycetaceae bacterium]